MFLKTTTNLSSNLPLLKVKNKPLTLTLKDNPNPNIKFTFMMDNLTWYGNHSNLLKNSNLCKTMTYSPN